nr:putative capsid [Marmot picobirnavirus]
MQKFNGKNPSKNGNRNNGKGNKKGGKPKNYVPKDKSLEGEINPDSVGKYSRPAPKTEGFNDVSWYAKNPVMLADSASYSYNNPLGSLFDWSTILQGGTNTTWDWRTAGFESIPGVMALELVPTIGVSKDASSPANLAAQNIYSFVRYHNSGSKNYDQADLMLYLLAMDSIYSYWNFCKRIYGIMAMYSQLNWYMPKFLIRACGVNFDDINKNLANFREWLNTTAAKITSFCVPASMSYFVRHSWLYSNVYKDSDNLKAQMYIFTPSLFYKYDETGSKFGGRLVPVTMDPSYKERTFDELRSIMDQMLDAVCYSEDVGVMSGDILKAYGDGSLFKLEPVSADYLVAPVYNEEVLNQIHNATIVESYRYMQDTDHLQITQDPDTGFLKFNPLIPNIQRMGVKGTILNMPWDVVTPANTMVGSRLAVCYQAGGATAYFTALGTEWVNRASILYRKPNNLNNMDWGRVAFDNNILYDDISSQQANASSSMRIAALSNFDWHPLFYLANHSDLETAPINFYFSGVLGDMCNYTILSENDLMRMHLTAVMSEFNIPQLGSF